MKYYYENLYNIIKSSSALFYVYYDEKHTYQECHQNMLKLNSVLHKVRNKRIALYVSKSFNSYCAIFAVILSGNTWIPFSPSQPAKRSLDMLTLAEPYLIITDEDLPELIASYARDNNIGVVRLQEIVNGADKTEFALSDFKKDDIAYIMFTSGSTGVPKGVPMTHENYINFIETALKILPFGRGEVFSDFHEFSFDISIFYLFCAIFTESAFAPIIKPEEKFFPLANIVDNKVTVWSSVPSVISQIKTLRPTEKINTPIKIMFLCGEPFRLDVLKYCHENMNIKRIYNFYGLTETGVENFYHECRPDDLRRFEMKGFLPIGKPLPGNNVSLTEDNELLLSGCQVTPGYLAGIAKDRFKHIDGVRWFYTGDIVEKYEDVYFCKGRLDNQVKLNGYRIELMDIETHVRRFEAVRDAVCFVDNAADRPTLVCALEAQQADTEKLKNFLKSVLPSYMIPQKYFLLDVLPKNSNGKIDRPKVVSLHKGMS